MHGDHRHMQLVLRHQRAKAKTIRHPQRWASARMPLQNGILLPQGRLDECREDMSKRSLRMPQVWAANRSVELSARAQRFEIQPLALHQIGKVLVDGKGHVVAAGLQLQRQAQQGKHVARAAKTRKDEAHFRRAPAKSTRSKPRSLAATTRCALRRRDPPGRCGGREKERVADRT